MERKRNKEGAEATEARREYKRRSEIRGTKGSMFEEIRKEGTRVENEGKQRAAEEEREGHDRNGDWKRKETRD